VSAEEDVVIVCGMDWVVGRVNWSVW